MERSPAQEQSHFGKKPAQRQRLPPSSRQWGNGEGNCNSMNCSHLAAPGAQRLPAAALLAVGYRFAVQPTALKQESSNSSPGAALSCLETKNSSVRV